MTELDDAILSQLRNHPGAATYSYLTAVLPQWDFDAISRAVYDLSQKEKLFVDGEGIKLVAGDSLQFGAQRASSPQTEIHANDELIGTSSATESAVCISLSREEAQALIGQDSDNRDNTPRESERPITTANSPRYKDHAQYTQEEPIICPNLSTDVDTINLSVRTRRALKRNNLRNIGAMVQAIGNPSEITGLGERGVSEIVSYLEQAAKRSHRLLSSAQLKSIRHLSRNANYYFDAFGALTAVQQNTTTTSRSTLILESGADSEGETAISTCDNFVSPISIDELNVPEAVSRCFRRNKILTLEDVLNKTDEQLLSLPGIGKKKIRAVRDAVEDYLASTQASGVTAKFNLSKREAVDDFVDKWPKRTIRLIKRICKQLPEHGLSPYQESLLITFLPEAANAITTAGKDQSAAEALLLETILGSPEAADARATLLRLKIHASKTTEENERIECSVAIPRGKLWENAAKTIVQDYPECSYVSSRNKIEFLHPSLREWVKSLPKRDRGLLKLRLRGGTLDACAKRAKVSKARAGQIIKRILDSRPLLKEDRFRKLYQTYDLTIPLLIQLTKLNERGAKYLELTTKRGEKLHTPLQKALSDEEVPNAVRKRIRLHINSDFIFTDGERVHKDRRSITLHLANRLTTRSDVTMQELFDAYSSFLKKNAPQSKELSFSSEHAFAEWVRKNIREILNVPKPKRNKAISRIRYYDTDSYDFTKLEELFASGQFDNIECSAALIFNHPGAQEVMQELDINDEYELHCIAKNYCTMPSNVSFGRTPTIVFGEGSRNRQVLELIQEYGPIDAFSLAELYSQRYGVSEDTFKGSYLNEFRIYKSRGKYSCSLEKMTNEQLDTLSELLTRDYQPLSLIKIQFENRYPNSSIALINASNLEAVGFRASHGLVIRKNLEEDELFKDIIAKNRAFSTETQGFFLDVFKHPNFKSILQSQINSLDIIEYEKGKYIHFSAIVEVLDGKLSKNDLRDFIDKAVDFAGDNVPFTMNSLRNQGFSHPVEKFISEVGFGDELLESLIATAYVGGRVKRTSVDENYVFCKTSFSFTVVDLFEYVVSELKCADIDDLCYSIHNQYGVTINKSLARSIIKRSDLYFHEDLDMVFESASEYNRKVNEWIC